METKEKLIESYDLSDEELNSVGKIIYDKYTFGKGGSDRPFAIIVIGQPGAGKSGLMGFSENQFETAISLDIDDLRAYHPKYDDVKANHPEIFEKVTGKFASSMIHLLTPKLIEEKRNLILHKTRGDDAVINDTIIPLQNEGYDIIIRVLSVNQLESKMSALERSLEERDRFGCCRWVARDYHTKHYNGIVDLVDKIDKNKYADLVEIFVRGKIPVEPELVYAKVLNDKICTNPHIFTREGFPVVDDFALNDYPSPKDALVETREMFIVPILSTLNDRLENAKGKCDGSHVEDEFITEIEEIAQDYMQDVEKKTKQAINLNINNDSNRYSKKDIF